MIRIRSFALSDHHAALSLWSSVEHLGPVSRADVEQKLTRDPQLFRHATSVAGVNRDSRRW